ncbi:hypothetical protein ACS0TY_016310 [Phlomoides rotata]
MSSLGMTSGRKSSRNVAIGSNSLIWGIVWCLYRTNQGECALKHKLKWKSGLNTGSNGIDYGGMKMCVTDGNVGPDGSEFLYMHGMKGAFVRLDHRTKKRSRLDYTRVLVSVPFMNDMNISFTLIIDGKQFKIKVIEELP